MGRGPSKRQGPHRVDAHVGGRVRLRRIFLGYSQEKLGQALGLTFQQIQKYERGVNRISASKLYELSNLLDVPVGFFFEGLEDELPPSAAKLPESRYQIGRAAVPEEPDLMARRETILLVSRFYNLPNDTLRREILSLLKAMSD